MHLLTHFESFVIGVFFKFYKRNERALLASDFLLIKMERQ